MTDTEALVFVVEDDAWLRMSLQDLPESRELRAARRLSRLWQPQGTRAEAYDLLAPVYGWFAAGCDTAALQEPRGSWTRWRAPWRVRARSYPQASLVNIRG